jgi:UDP-N-acetylmuramoylalanine--D-glutamate ligase
LRKQFPDKELLIADRNDKIETLIKDGKVRFFTGPRYLDALADDVLVFKSPGIVVDHLSENITSQTDKFLELYGKQTIGVTGTKGKSTTASLIYHLLKKSGKKAVLLGNIGVPAFDRLDEIDQDTVVVYELSAHQLQIVHHSPGVAVLLNIYPEHLDHFGSFELYRQAKWNINLYQDANDHLMISEELNKEVENRKPSVQFFSVPPKSYVSSLLGVHNQKNMDAALKAVSCFGVRPEEAIPFFSDFQPLPHRLEYVGTYQGVHFYNDSIATVPEAVIEAVKTLERVHTLILGGFDRGLDYAELLCFVRDHPHIRRVIFTGEAGKVMFKMIKTQPDQGKRYFLAEDMKSVFEIIKREVNSGETVLLSPAAASYDRYHNFEHRGNIFKEFVKSF